MMNTFLQVPLASHTRITQLTPHLETRGPQMAQSNISSNQDDVGRIFLEAFQVYTNNLINSLPQQKDEIAIAIAVESLLAQINTDHNRLIFVIDTIQVRVKRDVAWVDFAISIYDGIALFIDLTFSGPGLPAEKRGSWVVQHYLLQSIQDDFNREMTMLLWNVGLIHFIGRLGASRNSIGALTSPVIFHVLGRMMLSEELFNGENLGLCLDYIVHVGPFMDSEAAGAKDEFTGMLMQLRERVKSGGTVTNMAMRWVLKLREDGWRAQQVE
jgi:hypothetical protein